MTFFPPRFRISAAASWLVDGSMTSACFLRLIIGRRRCRSELRIKRCVNNVWRKFKFKRKRRWRHLRSNQNNLLLQPLRTHTTCSKITSSRCDRTNDVINRNQSDGNVLKPSNQTCKLISSWHVLPTCSLNSLFFWDKICLLFFFRSQMQPNVLLMFVFLWFFLSIFHTFVLFMNSLHTMQREKCTILCNFVVFSNIKSGIFRFRSNQSLK